MNSDYMEGLIRRTANRLGIDIHRHRPEKLASGRLSAMLATNAIDLVLDVGANTGQFAKSLRKAGYLKQIVSFEPLSFAHAELLDASRYDARWEIAPRAAIGDFEGEIDINVAANSFSSSALRMLDSHKKAAPGSAYVGTERVRLVRLDTMARNYMEPDSSLFVKIDTQGYEDRVIAGASNMLDKVRGLQLELSFVPLYEGQLLMTSSLDDCVSSAFRSGDFGPESAIRRVGECCRLMQRSFAIEKMGLERLPPMRHVMKSTPRLSIVIATWNAAHTLERCLRSIMAQDFDDWEILISDGGSTDGTIDLILREEPAIGWWQTKKDKGIYDAWNQALDHARGEYVAFLGADDTLHNPGSLRHVFELIGEEKYDLVTGRGVLVNQDGQSYYEFGNAWDYKKLRRRMTICHPGALHRRDLFEQYGKFDTTYRISADYDFLLRLPAGLRALHLNMPITTIADAGISRNQRWLMLRERYRAQANCPRIGAARAAFNFIDKLWRIPVAKALGIPN